MRASIPTDVLRYAREMGKVSQATVAKALGTVPSVLSKVERADTADADFADRYLHAVGTDLSQNIINYYARDWLNPPPSFLHPDHESLWAIDQAQSDLKEFERALQDPILRAPVQLLNDELNSVQTYLRRQDHMIAWVGDIGVGKTTALSNAVGFMVGDGRSGRRPAFPTGSGRVTVCETAIRPAPTFGVIVDAVEDEEVFRLTRDLISSLQPGAAGVGVSAEVGRLLRNMAKMKITTSTHGDDDVTIDPISDLLAKGLEVSAATDLVVGAMTLNARTEQQIILPEGTEDGMQWVAKLVSDINSGQDQRFSLPKKITVLMPVDNLTADGLTLSVIDTRGVEGITQRPDLALHNEDPRTLVVLCTKFADAPNATVQRYLREDMEAELDAIERRRCILVLPRGDEALEVPGLDPDTATRKQGYALRRKDVELAMINAALPKTPVFIYDAKTDPAAAIWQDLRTQVQGIRKAFADRGMAAAAGVRNLIDNVADARANEARREIETELKLLLSKEVLYIRDTIRPAHSNLIAQMSVGHHSSIAASINRHGAWSNFEFSHILGNGVRVDANLRTQELVKRIKHRLENFETKFADMETVQQTLAGLRTRLKDAQQEFLSVSRTIGSDAYGTLLDDAGDIWTKTAERYGKGPGYKQDITEEWRKWFETNDEVVQTSSSVSARLQNAWDSLVIQPLCAAIETNPDQLRE
jgi:transcriptional regulator with XRE-family HTH domain